MESEIKENFEIKAEMKYPKGHLLVYNIGKKKNIGTLLR